MKFTHISLSLLMTFKLCAGYFDTANSIQSEIQKNRDFILSEVFSVEEGLHPIVEEFRVQILDADEPLDFHEGKQIKAETDFLEWYLIRPLFEYYVRDPTGANLSEFEHICNMWVCRSQLGILIKLATYEKLKKKIEGDSIAALDTGWAVRDLALAAETEYGYYLEALASPELMQIIVTDDKLSAHEIKMIQDSERYENRLHFKRMIEAAKSRDIAEMAEIQREAVRIKSAGDDKNLVFKVMWPNWSFLLNKIQQYGGINSVPLRSTP